MNRFLKGLSYTFKRNLGIEDSPKNSGLICTKA